MFLIVLLYTTLHCVSSLHRLPDLTTANVQSHFIATALSPNHLLPDNLATNTLKLIDPTTQTDNDDPTIEESEATRIGYIIDQKTNAIHCSGCGANAFPTHTSLRKSSTSPNLDRAKADGSSNNSGEIGRNNEDNDNVERNGNNNEMIQKRSHIGDIGPVVLQIHKF